MSHAAPALAWQQYHTSTGAPMRWPTAVIAQPLPYSMDATGLGGDGLAPVEVAAAVDAAFARWQSVACPVYKDTSAASCTQDSCCGDRTLGVHFANVGWQAPAPMGLACAPTESGPCDYEPDGNQILFVHNAKDWPFGSLVIAMTVVSALPENGDIADADIALNDAGFAFCQGVCSPGQVHLGAVIQHEAGHFLGLDHSGKSDAIMFAKPPAQITAIGDLTSDDIDGICAAYPADVTPTACAPAAAATADRRASAASCRAARSPADGAPGPVAFGMAVLFLRAARRRAATSAHRSCRPHP